MKCSLFVNDSLSSVRILAGLSAPSERLKDVFSFVGLVMDSPQFVTWLMKEVCML